MNVNKTIFGLNSVEICHELVTPFVTLKYAFYPRLDSNNGSDRSLIIVCHGRQPDPATIDTRFLFSTCPRFGYVVGIGEAMMRPEGETWKNWMSEKLKILQNGSWQYLTPHPPLHYIGPHTEHEIRPSIEPLNDALSYADIVIPYELEISTSFKENFFSSAFIQTGTELKKRTVRDPVTRKSETLMQEVPIKQLNIDQTSFSRDLQINDEKIPLSRLLIDMQFRGNDRYRNILLVSCRSPWKTIDLKNMAMPSGKAVYPDKGVFTWRS